MKPDELLKRFPKGTMLAYHNCGRRIPFQVEAVGADGYGLYMLGMITLNHGTKLNARVRPDRVSLPEDRVNILERQFKTAPVEDGDHDLTPGRIVFSKTCGIGRVLEKNKFGKFTVEFEDHSGHTHDYKPEELELAVVV